MKMAIHLCHLTCLCRGATRHLLWRRKLIAARRKRAAINNDLGCRFPVSSADFWLCLRKFCVEADRGRLAGQGREFITYRKSTAQIMGHSKKLVQPSLKFLLKHVMFQNQNPAPRLLNKFLLQMGFHDELTNKPRTLAWRIFHLSIQIIT